MTKLCNTNDVKKDTLKKIRARLEQDPRLTVNVRNNETGEMELKQLVQYNGDMFFFKYGKFNVAKGFKTFDSFKNHVTQIKNELNRDLISGFNTTAAKGYVNIVAGTDQITMTVKMPPALEKKYNELQAKNLEEQLLNQPEEGSQLSLFPTDQEKSFLNDTPGLPGLSGFQMFDQDPTLFEIGSEQEREASLRYVVGSLKKLGLDVQIVDNPSFKGKWEVDQYGRYTFYISNTAATLDTPFHEFIEPFIVALQKTKPEVVDALFDSLSKTASGKRIIESVSNARKELKGNALKVEVLAQAVGEYSALDVLTKKAYSSSFRTALANFFREITNILKRFFGGRVSIKDINENTKLEDIVKYVRQGRIRLPQDPRQQVKEVLSKLNFKVGDDIMSEKFTYDEALAIQQQLQSDSHFFGSKQDRVAVFFRSIPGTDTFMISKIVPDVDGRNTSLSNKQLSIYAPIDEIEQAVDDALIQNPNLLDEITGPDIVFDRNADPLPNVTFDNEKNELLNILFNFDTLSIDHFIERLEALESSTTTRDLLVRLRSVAYNTSTKVVIKSLPSTSRISEYDPSTNTIYINSNLNFNFDNVESLVDALTHEIIHSKTAYVLKQFIDGNITDLTQNEINFCKKVKQLYDKALVAARAVYGNNLEFELEINPNLYGLKDVYEFISETLTNKNFQNFLEEVSNLDNLTQYKTQKAKKFLFDIINSVLEFLGLDFRLGTTETEGLLENFFTFQETYNKSNDPSRFRFSTSAPFALDVTSVLNLSQDEYSLLNSLEKNLRIQIQQLEDLTRIAETEEEIEDRSFYARELKQRKAILEALRELKEAQSYKEALEFFIRSTYDRINLLYNDLQNLSDAELIEPSTRNKLFLLQNYLRVINPAINRENSIVVKAEITENDRRLAREYTINKEQKEREYINGTITADEFDDWMENNPDPTSIDIIYERVDNLDKDVKELLKNKAYPAMANWLAEDFTDEDLMQLDQDFKEEVDNIMRSKYSDGEKLKMIKKAKLESVKGTKALFVRQLELSLVSTHASTGMDATLDLFGFPVINNSDLALSLFAKKVKHKLQQSRRRTADVQETLMEAFRYAFGNKKVTSPEAFFENFIEEGVYKIGKEIVRRPKLVSEYNMDQFKLNQALFFDSIEQYRTEKLDALEESIMSLRLGGTSEVDLLVIRSNEIINIEEEINNRIKSWYNDNTKKFEASDIVVFKQTIELNRNAFTDVFNTYFNKILNSVNGNSSIVDKAAFIAKLNEYNDKFSNLRDDRETTYDADKTFLQWYSLEKLRLQNNRSNPDSQYMLMLLEKMRNYFDYQEQQYKDWYESNVRYSEITGDVYPKGKSIIPADKYLNQKWANLSSEEKTFLEVLEEVNRTWQNRIPVSERLPEGMLPVVARDMGLISPIEDFAVNRKKSGFLRAAKEAFGGVLSSAWKSVTDMFKTVYSDLDYTNQLERIQKVGSGFSERNTQKESRQIFPVYYTNYSNPNIVYNEIEKNPMISLFKAHMMANDYDVKNDLFSEIALMDYIMSNRSILTQETLDGFLTSGVLQSEDVNDVVQNTKVQKTVKSEPLINRIKNGALKLLWNYGAGSRYGMTSAKGEVVPLDEILDNIDQEYDAIRGLTRTSMTGTTVSQSERNINKSWEFFKRNNFFLQNQKQAFGSWGVVKPLIYWKSLIGLAGNLYSAIRTVFTGTLHNLISAHGKQTFSKRDLFIGAMKATMDILRLFADQNLNRLSSKSSARARHALERLDALQGESDKRSLNRVGMQRRIIAMLNSPIATLGFGAQSYTEGFIALQTLYATQRSIKVRTRNNELISMDKAYEFKNGVYRVSPLVASTKEEVDEFHKFESAVIDATHKVMKENQGIYDKFNKIMLSESLLGQAFLQFRKWVIPNITKKSQRFKLDVETKRMKKGYYRVFLNSMFRDGIFKGLLKTIYNGLNIGNDSFYKIPVLSKIHKSLSDTSGLEKSMMRSITMDTLIIIALGQIQGMLLNFAVTAAGDKPDDDDEISDKTDKLTAYLLYFVKSTKMEMNVVDPISFFSSLATLPIGAQIHAIEKTAYYSLVWSGRYIYWYTKDGVDYLEAYEEANDDLRYTKKQGAKVVKDPKTGEYPTKLQVASKELIPSYTNITMLNNPYDKYNSLKKYEKKSFLDFFEALQDDAFGKRGGGSIRKKKSEFSESESESSSKENFNE